MRAFSLAMAAFFLAAVPPAKGQGPSFDCSNASQPAEFAICGNSRLSELDRILVAGYNFLKANEGLASADKIGKPYYYERVACGADVECIGKSQIREIGDLAAAGAPVALPEWLTAAKPAESDASYVPLVPSGGTFLVPVTVNEQITLKFVIDSGAADVSIPADVVLTLIRTGTISEDDFTGNQTYRLADGSTAPSQTFKIKSLRVGDRVLHNVAGSIAPVQGSLLLGQSFLGRFQTWSIDNKRQALVLQ